MPSLPFTRFHVRLWREPHRQQVIIFRAPLPGSDEDYIKRLIGMPGDTVQIQRGVVFVNGAALAEPYRNAAPNPADNYGLVTIPAHDFCFWETTGTIPTTAAIGDLFLRPILSALPSSSTCLLKRRTTPGSLGRFASACTRTSPRWFTPSW